MTPLHFLYSLHMLSVTPLFWLVLRAVEESYRYQDTRRTDGGETRVFPTGRPAAAVAARRLKVRGRRPVPHIGERPTARRGPAPPSSPAVIRSPVSWLTTKASGDTSAHVVYRGRLSGSDLWLHYGFDGWQGPVREVRLEPINSGWATSALIPLDGHITLDCVV